MAYKLKYNFDPSLPGTSKGVQWPGGLNTTPYLHGYECPDYENVLKSQKNWTEFVKIYKPFVEDALNMAKKQHDKDPSNDRQLDWYLFCIKSLEDFNKTVTRIQSTPETYYNAADLEEAIELLKLIHLIDQEEYEAEKAIALRIVESAPVLTSSDDEIPIELNWEDWLMETKAIENQIINAIHRARDKKDRARMLLLKEKLKKLQRYLEATNLEISSAIKRSEDKLAQKLMFKSLETLFSEAYSTSTLNVSRLPVYRTPSGGGNIIPKRTDLKASRLPVSRRAEPLSRQIEQMRVPEKTVRPISKRSQYKIQAGPSKALLQMRSRTKHLGNIPQPRSVSAMSIAEKRRLQKQAIASREQFVNRQEKIRRGQLPLAKKKSSNSVLVAPKSSRRGDAKTPAPMPQPSAQDLLEKTTKKRELDSRMRADIVSAKALNSVKKCMQDFRIPVTGVASSHSRHQRNRPDTETETDIMSAMEGDRNQPIATAKGLAKKLQDLLVVAKKGKSLKSAQIGEAVVREIDKLRSFIRPHPTSRQLIIPAQNATAQSWIDYFLQIYENVELTNSVQLEQLRQAADDGNIRICSKKIEELARSKAKYHKIIQEAVRNNDINKLGKIVFEAIGTLETSQYLCGDPTIDGQPNTRVKITSRPKLPGGIDASAHHGAVPKRIIPSDSKISVSRPQNSSSRKNVSRPNTAPAESVNQRNQQLLKEDREHRQHAQAKYPESVLSKYSKSEVSIPVRRTQSRRSESSVSFQQPLHRRDATTPVTASRPRSAIPTAVPRENQAYLQMANQPPARRLQSTGAALSNSTARSMTDEQREARAVRTQIMREDLELSKRLGAQRRLDAERAAAKAQQFGAQGRSTKLPTLQIKKSAITEQAKRRIQQDQQKYMSVKKSTGTVKKQLYAIPQYREDQQRRGPTLPARDVKLKLPEVQPFAEPGTAYKQILEQEALQHQVKSAAQLLGKASRIKSGPRARNLHKQLAGVALPSEPSIRNRPVVESQHLENEQVERQPIRKQQMTDVQMERLRAMARDRLQNTSQPLGMASGRNLTEGQPHVEPGTAYKQTQPTPSRPRAKQMQVADESLPSGPSIRNRPFVESEHREIVHDTRHGRLVLTGDQLERFRAMAREKLLNSSQPLRLKAISNAHRVVQNREASPPPSREATPQPNREATPQPNREATPQPNREATPQPKVSLLTKMNDLRKVWNDTKEKLIKDNAAAVLWAKTINSQNPSIIAEQLILENVQKQTDALRAVDEIEQTVSSAIQTGDLEQVDDAIFSAIERILQDEYICIGDPNILKDLQPGERGYNREQLKKINYEISAEIAEEGFQRRSCVGMVRMDGVLIPHGWIKPTEEQIQAKLIELGNPDERIGLQDMVTLFPVETQDQRVPKNIPGDLPYSRKSVNRELKRPFPFMDFDNNLLPSLLFMADEGQDDSDAFSAKAKRVLNNPRRLADYKRDRRLLNEYDNETIYEMMLVVSTTGDMPTKRDDKIDHTKFWVPSRDVRRVASNTGALQNGSIAEPSAPASSTVTIVPEQNPHNNAATDGQKQQQNTVGIYYAHGMEPTKNWCQLRGSIQPDWFPGFYTGFPNDGGLTEFKTPSQTMLKAWSTMKPTLV